MRATPKKPERLKWITYEKMERRLEEIVNGELLMVNEKMKKWKEVKLNEIGYLTRGRSKHRPRDASHLYGGSYPFIQTADVKHANLYINSYSQTYSDEGLRQSKLWKKGTLCITIAANIAESAILGIDACFPDSIIGFVPDESKSDVLFIKYSLDIFQKNLQGISQGAAQDNLSMEKLLSLPFPLPPLPTQQRIAAILSSYDDLIENNRRRITLLEDSARLLYKEWFVKFQFPGHEKVKVKNGLPEGWGRKKIGEVGNVITGKTPSTQDSSNYGGDILFIKTPDFHSGIFVIDTETKLTEKGASTQQNKFVPANTILTACIGNGLGVVSMTSKKSQFNQQINGFISHDSQYLYYFYITFCGLKSKLESIGASATMPNVNKSVFEGIEINIPSQSIAYNFHELATPIFKQILTLQHQTQKLREARNILLPKLMNGTIEV